MQQQLLLPREAADTRQMENYLGLVSYLTDPFNLFLRVADLENEDVDLVYFFVYSLGKKKIMLWGTYSKSEQDFHIEAACRYSVAQLMPIYKYWLSQDYSYVANAVVDRIGETLGKYGGKSRMSKEEYQKKKTFLAFERKEISRAQIPREVGANYPEEIYDKLAFELIENEKLSSAEEQPLETKVFQLALQRYLRDIEKELQAHEASINRLDLKKEMNFKFSKRTLSELKQITQKFIRKIEKSSLTDDKVYEWLPACPAQESCRPGVDGTCGVYFYGTQLLDPRDLR